MDAAHHWWVLPGVRLQLVKRQLGRTSLTLSFACSHYIELNLKISEFLTFWGLPWIEFLVLERVVWKVSKRLAHYFQVNNSYIGISISIGIGNYLLTIISYMYQNLNVDKTLYQYKHYLHTYVNMKDLSSYSAVYLVNITNSHTVLPCVIAHADSHVVWNHQSQVHSQSAVRWSSMWPNMSSR